MRGMFGLTAYQQLMTGTAVVAAMAVASPAMAQTRTFDVPAGPSTKTIPILAKQAGVQIIGSGRLLRSVRTKAVKGNFTVTEALSRMLAGTGLSGSEQADGVIQIGLVRRGNGPSPEATGTDENSQSAISDILVIGSRSRNVDVRRTRDDAQPYVVFDKEAIQSSQATSVEDFLKTRLPSNSNYTGSQAQITGSGLPFSTFNLRGLGSNQTLILVNGRRLPQLANQNFAPSQADINGIPIGSIERIEVLPSSAGGIYGGNAVGGVINIILRSDYKGFDIAATYNDTFDFKAPNGRLDINGGFALEGGRTTVTFGGSISRAGTLRVGDRVELIKDGIDLYRKNVNIYASNGNPPVGNGVNIRSSTGANLVFKPQYGGANLGSNITNLPLGYGGIASDNGALLLANAGKFNLDIPNDLLGSKRGLLTPPQTTSGNISIRRKFADFLDLFVDFSHFENKGVTYSANQLPTTALIQANSPVNPFQQAIRVSFDNPNYSFRQIFSSTTNTFSGGAIVRLPFKWGLNVEYNKTWSQNDSSFYNATVDSYGTYCGTQATVDPVSCTANRPALNVLQSPVDYGSYLFTSPTFVGGPYKSTFSNPSARASGPLFKLPGGAATATLAIQREASSFEDSRNVTVNQSTRQPLYTTFPGSRQATTSEYGEVVLPILSPKNGVPLIRELEIRGALRHDVYSTISPPATSTSFTSNDPAATPPAFTPLEARFRSTNYTIAGRYSPFNGLVLRASYATGFLPPSVVQLGSQAFAAPFGLGIPDPQRGNEIISYPLTQIAGSGNLALQPEKSRTLSFGGIITPLEGLRFSADYTLIRKSGEIGTIPYATLLANPSLFPGRVVRAAPQSGDPAGYPGQIVTLDISPINFNRSTFKAVDFQLDYNFETRSIGKFRFYALATWQPDSIRQIQIGTAALNYSGNVDGPEIWQGNGGFDWTLGNVSAQWNTQFYSAHHVYATYDTSTAGGLASQDSDISVQGRTSIPAQVYSDLYLSYAFGITSGVLSGVRLSAGMQNVFNTRPPTYAISSYIQQGYDTYGDPRLRRFTLSIRKSFGK